MGQCRLEKVLSACWAPFRKKKIYFFPRFFRKELMDRLDQFEKENSDGTHLEQEYEDLSKENQSLSLAQSRCKEQLEKLRIQYQKRQGSS